LIAGSEHIALRVAVIGGEIVISGRTASAGVGPDAF
jgi:hypothetical protein